jgi:glycosyltransferase involved in cell wall biosynthesis
MPAITGNGLAMRAAAVLLALTELYQVTLLVEEHYAGESELGEDLRALCTRVEAFSPNTVRPDVFEVSSFDVVHVFRVAALKAAGPYLLHTPQRHLDLDDVESATHQRLAALYRQNGEDALAQVERLAASRALKIEDFVLQHFQRVYVCSDQDRRRLSGRGKAKVVVLPNVVPLRSSPPNPPRDGAFTFLFIGTLDYYPNAEGIRWWCTEVLPRLRTLAVMPFRLIVAGSGDAALLADSRSNPEVEPVGFVDDVAEAYACSHAAIIPIRAGGGTRIKLLEAFSFRRPVVSTNLGVEGIDVRHNREVLLADTPTDFAMQCARLLSAPDLRARLSRAGFDCLERNFSPRSLLTQLSQPDLPKTSW